jgi:hypothetical protein
MADAVRIPCASCAIMMLAETGAQTGGLCMRCFGTAREDRRNQQVPTRAPSARTTKYARALTRLDLETFPIWVRCVDDDARVRPASSRALTTASEFVMAANLKFSDGSDHFGGMEVTDADDVLRFSAPFLLRPGERVDFNDHTASYTFVAITPKLIEELRRKFAQNMARLERQIGQPLERVFPISFQLRASTRRGVTPAAGELPMPSFQAPIAAASV